MSCSLCLKLKMLQSNIVTSEGQDSGEKGKALLLLGRKMEAKSVLRVTSLHSL